jgi:hypothetical protein
MNTNGEARLGECEQAKPRRHVTAWRALLAVFYLGLFAVIATAIVAGCVVLFRAIVR